MSEINQLLIIYLEHTINEFIMCGFYCIAFIEYMLAGKTLLDYTNLLFPNDYKKNEKIICKYFKNKYGRRCKSAFRLEKLGTIF